jgi:hypothetical protein
MPDAGGHWAPCIDCKHLLKAARKTVSVEKNAAFKIFRHILEAS